MSEPTKPAPTRGFPCRDCGVLIYFLRTKIGKSIPCNLDTVPAGAKDYDPKKHTAHAITCPAAKAKRKKK